MSESIVEEKLLITKINDYDNKEIIKNFDCGNDVINSFIKRSLNSHEQSVIYLLIKDNKDLVGFFSLMCSSLLEVNKDGKPISSDPSIEIKMFAIDNKYQDKKSQLFGHTYAHIMLDRCIAIIKEISIEVGATYIILNSTKEGHDLYKYIGDFIDAEEDQLLPDWKSDKDAIRMYREIYQTI